MILLASSFIRQLRIDARPYLFFSRDLTFIFLVHLIFSFREKIVITFFKYKIGYMRNITHYSFGIIIFLRLLQLAYEVVIHFLQNLDSSPMLRCGIGKPYHEWLDFLLWRAISFSLNNSSILSANSLKVILNIFHTTQAYKNHHRRLHLFNVERI